MTRKQHHTPTYKVIANRVYRTTGQQDPCNGGDDLEFVREFVSHAAALRWLWMYHPVQ